MDTFAKLEKEMAERARKAQAEIDMLTAISGKTVDEIDADLTAPDPGGEE